MRPAPTNYCAGQFVLEVVEDSAEPWQQAAGRAFALLRAALPRCQPSVSTPVLRRRCLGRAGRDRRLEQLLQLPEGRVHLPPLLVSPAAYRALVVDAGWSHAEWVAWTSDALAEQVFEVRQVDATLSPGGWSA